MGTYAALDSSHVRLLTASVTRVGTVSATDMTNGSAPFLAFWATIPYTGSDPTRAQDWVKANAGKPGATMTIDSAFFEIDPTPSDLNSRRLNVIAVGAR